MCCSLRDTNPALGRTKPVAEAEWGDLGGRDADPRQERSHDVTTSLRCRPGRNAESQPFGSKIASATGALAIGGLALGAGAVAALAIGRLAIRRGVIQSLRIENLEVERLRVGDREVQRERRPG